MAGEYVSGVRFKEGDEIKGYQILNTFDPGAFAYAAKARSSDGRTVFFKKYKRPGAASPWYDKFVAYQQELKRRIQSDPGAKNLCYEFIEFFEVKKPGGAVPLRAFYQVFEWVDGGTDLRGVVDVLKSKSKAFDWKQRVIFARVMMAGINAIHKAGIIHTDLKPENFYLLPEPAIAAKYKLRVIDMDFSLVEGKRAPWDGQEGYVGTPGYMSPEHLRNEVPVKASDVFTCSLILGELLGGAHPSSGNMEAFEENARTGKLRPVKLAEPISEVSDLGFLEHVIACGLRPEASKRPTAEQMLLALNGRLSGFDGVKPKDVGKVIPHTSAPASTTPKCEVSSLSETPHAPARTGVLISAYPEQTLAISISTTLGRAHFKAWGTDFERFMSAEQFRLEKQKDGSWTIAHCSSAANATNVSGAVLSNAVTVTPEMEVTLGKTGKCLIKLNLF